jgi:hypothetical protein
MKNTKAGVDLAKDVIQVCICKTIKCIQILRCPITSF